VAQGDTLQGIARGAHGDESLWYLIAEANGLSGNADLKAGQVLTVLARIGSANKAGTFKPYDPSAVIGDTTPNMPVPKPGAGMILAGVIVVVLTVYTVGPASSASGAFVSTMQAGATATSAGTAASTLTVRHINPNIWGRLHLHSRDSTRYPFFSASERQL
jgi:hypothetical protein